ncbi:hypothetical protein TRFO_16746 [Tritrichomonas foetus]|uniref:Leucine Rich Repeat family protein n=1 Tax=Tritrichomonas foetus TaxID=1144522 RepID=A0A1J4KPH3_9EUKA|nr:hypothetical protein TRFO_16746 [Tritrichomonas foetus]|eukprot:OHT13191.1 hypothetical protein TRFO_16746 [Tritrichomonas foetus]
MSDSTTFSFTFRTAKVVLSHPNAQSFLAPVLSALRALLPAQNAYCIHAPAGMLIPSSTPQPTQFVDLFISFCHSMNLTINDNLIVNFKRTLLKKQPLEILQVSFDKNILQAICRALIFVRTVKDLKIGGFTFSDLYLDITRILMNNNTLETLKVVNYTKKKNFSDFILSMPRSSIKSLTFQSITFQRSMIQSLVNSICISPNLKHIGFVNCGFDSFVFGAIFDTPENFKNIESFEISKDESEISLSFIPNIISFILVAGITSLNLTEMALDIALVFSSIENTPDLEIHTLNLSGNYCSKLYKRGYTFPHTFEILKLAEVRWDGQTLCDFLTMQHFKSEISLDLSSVSFPGSTESEPFELLNGKIFSTKVSKFIWNNNFLTPTFLKFIEKNESIRVLSYEMCSIPLDARNDFLEALSNFISNSSVTYLSLRGSLRTFKSKAIYALKKSLIKHDLFEELNISDNVFCDKGIEALGEIISQSNNIQYIKCDGEDPSSPDNILIF